MADKEIPVHFIRRENFEQEVVCERKPVLILCMLRTEEFPNQLSILEKIGRKYGEQLKAALLDEAFIESFKKNYRFVGTPIFLLLVEGKEKKRFLGLADPEKMMDLIAVYLA